MVINIRANYIYLLSVVVIIFTFLISSFVLGGEIYNASLPLSGKCVVIDAGHGGLDGGASSQDGTVEKNINLKIAKNLQQMLEKNGAKVIMTRSTDISLHDDDNASVKQKKRSDLNNRREIANNSDADFLISIHLNYFVESQYKGAQVFYEGNHPESKILAQLLQKSLIENVDSSNTRVAKKLDTQKLLFSNLKIPGVIAECGFLSNSGETQLLKDSKYQKKIAEALYNGIAEYFKNEKPKPTYSTLVFNNFYSEVELCSVK